MAGDSGGGLGISSGHMGSAIGGFARSGKRYTDRNGGFALLYVFAWSERNPSVMPVRIPSNVKRRR